MVEYYDSDRDEGRMLNPSSTCRPKRRVSYKSESSSRSDSDGDAVLIVLAVHDQLACNRHQLRDVPFRPCLRRSCVSLR